MKPHRRGRATALIAVATLLWLGAGAVHAHATLVFGIASVSPDPPVPGAPFELTLTLEDPTLAPVEDAIVFVELRPLAADAGLGLPAPSTEAPDLPPPLVTERLIETEAATYRVEVTLPAAGSYHLLVRDQTFQWEEANASVILALTDVTVGRLPFILPPTQVAPRNLWTWLLWLVGLPVIAGAIVTVLVLTSAKAPAKAGGDEAA